MSAPGRVFPITIRRTFGALPEIHHVTWEGEFSVLSLFEAHRGLQLRSPTRPDEKPADLPLVAFGAFDQHDRKGVGCRETNLNPEGLHCIALDYDDLLPSDAQAVIQRAKQLNPQGLAHTTWNHGLSGGGAAVRMRVVMPLSGPVGEYAWPTVWAAVNESLGGLADTQCKNIGRFYFLPCVNLDAPKWVLGTDGGCWFESWGTGRDPLGTNDRP